MTDLDKRIEWLRARVPIEDVYLEHVRFIMQHYADEYHQSKLKDNEVLDLVSGCFPTDKEIELLSNEHSDDMGLRPNTYHSYKDGMEECIDIIKKSINNR